MTEDTKTAYETIDSLQMQGNYEELNQLAQYVVDAILNDEEKLTLELPTDPKVRPVKTPDPVVSGVTACR